MRGILVLASSPLWPASTCSSRNRTGGSVASQLQKWGDKWGERDQKTTGKILPAMMWRPTWIPRLRGCPQQHTQHPLGLM